MGEIMRAIEAQLIACHRCKAVCADADDAALPSRPPCCPRCGHVLDARRPRSTSHAWAFLLAAMALYVPANVLPVMHARVLDQGGDSTIVGGILEFWRSGAYGIALIVFIASIAVPCAKFAGISLLLVSTQYDTRVSKRMQSHLYRLIELIGYWSMLDVLVVGWAVSLSNFGNISEAEPRIGLVCFGLAVVFTMLSSKSFDPRLIWDASNK